MPLVAAATAPSRLFALVPCAGLGERAGAAGPKQYAEVAGKALVAHTLEALSRVTRLAATLVVLSPQDAAFEQHVVGFQGWTTRCGGATRAQTVANGLNELLARGARTTDWVLVHDAARCLVRPQWIDALIDACIDDAVGGLLALPLADTLKTEAQGRVAATVGRAGKWQAQTPQMFRLGALRDALTRAGPDATDEASAMEAMGHAPKLVACTLENLKVTFAADLDLAERLLRTRA
jgi:2-C-methyl-D-erythritol 4-phosphate cytidylyltransferase